MGAGEREDARPDVDGEFETDQWATALIAVPTGVTLHEYHRVGLLSMWLNSGF